MFASALFFVPLVAQVALAVCPGYNFAIGNAVSSGYGMTSWTVYDDGCNFVDGAILPSTTNPCNIGKFGCTPDPITFYSYHSEIFGDFSCRPDPNAGVCGSDTISVCCRNDGN